MSSSGTRSVSWLGLVVALAALALVTWWLAPDDATGDAAELSADRGAGAAQVMELTPAGGDAEARELAATPEPPSVDDASDEPRPDFDWPTRTVRGRVVRDDGEALPSGLAIFASSTLPPPRHTLASFATIGDESRSVDLAPGERRDWIDEALREATLTRLPADGRFEMQGVPTLGAWLAVEHDELYPRETVFVRPVVEGLEQQDAAREHVVELTLGAVIEGRMLDPDDAGVAGMVVSGTTPIDQFAIFDGGLDLVELGDATSDGAGRFRLVQVPAGVKLQVRAEGRAGWQGAAVDVRPLAPGEHAQVVLRTRRGATFSGVVVDEAGAPVPDVGLRAVSTEISATQFDMAGRPPFLRERSDADGRFEFAGVMPGGWRLLVASPGYRPVASDPVEVVGHEVIADLRLVAERGASVAGRVVDQGGEPVSGASILAIRRPNLMDVGARIDRMYRSWYPTAKDGTFDLAGFAPDAELRVSARAEGFVQANVDADAGDTDVLLTLTRRTALRGIAMDLELGEPLSEYTLRLVQGDGTLDFGQILELGEVMETRLPPLQVRHPEGRFRFEGVAPGEYTLVLSAEGYASTRLPGVVAEPGQETSGLILMVPPEARLEGLVVDERGGAPVPDARVTTGGVTMLSQLGSALGGPSPETRTDAAGRFSLGGLDDSVVTLNVVHPQYETWSLSDVAPNTGETFDMGLIRLSRGAAVYGTLRDAARQPQPGVTIYVADPLGSSMKRAESDAEGFWRVEGLPAGTYNVTRMDIAIDAAADDASGYFDDVVTRAITLAQGEEREVDLSRDDAQGGTRLEGNILASSGPAPRATVFCLPEEGETRVRFASADDDGHYVFENLPQGEYLLQVMPDLSEMGAGGQPMAPIVELVDVGVGPVQKHDVRVPTGELHGSVSDARSGEDLEGVRVTLERTDEALPASRFLGATGGRVGETLTDGSGAFTFRYLPPGTYSVVAGGVNLLGMGRAGYAVTRVDELEVREGRRGFRVDVELQPGGALEGTIKDTAGKPLVNVPLWAHDDEHGRWLSPLSETVTDGKGGFRLEGLEPGTWTLVAGGSKYGLSRAQGLHVARERATRADMILETGVEILVDTGPYLARDLTAVVTDGLGAVPVHLSSLADLMRSQPGGGRMRVGRLPPGGYDVTVLAHGEVVHQQTVQLGASDPFVLELDQEPQGGAFVYELH